MEEGKLAQISGGVAINERLFSLLRDLRDDFGKEAGILKQLSGDVVLEKFGMAYSRDKSVQLGFIIKIGASSCRFTLLKGLEKEGGFIVGVDLHSGKELALPKNFLSGIIGEIAIGGLGVYYSSKPFKNIIFFGGDDFATELS